MAALTETISFCRNCPWLNEGWAVLSEASPALNETSAVNNVEGNTIETQGSRRSRIHAFLKRVCRAIKKPFHFSKQIIVESQTSQENTHVVDTEPDPFPVPSGFQNTTDSGLNGEYEPNHDLKPVTTESMFINAGETGQVASWMGTISICCDLCPWLSDHWTVVSEASTPLYKTFPNNTVERYTTEPEPVPGASIYEPNNESLTNLYSFKNHLGYGAFGKVFKAIRNSDGKEVAIKRIPKRIYDRYIMIPGCTRSLFKEAALMLMLRRPPVSPYVIELFDWFDQPDYISLVMEYPQPSLSLSEYIPRNGIQSEEVARCLMRQLVMALQNCLDHGIVHNDLNYNNILVNTRTLEIKLIDFGCAFRISRDEHEGIMPRLLFELGLLLYYMFNGDPDAEQVESCISLIPSLSPECCNLMYKYLKRDSEWKTVDQILQHQWFKHQCLVN